MDQDTLKKHFHYDPETGLFSRKTKKNSNGSIDAYGYLILKFKRKQYKAHRMAWLYVYGESPDGVIDHINRDKLDNRISNLRCVDQAENSRNATYGENKETGFVGVYLDKTRGLKKKYAIKVKGRTHRFYNAREAYEFRKRKLSALGYGSGHF